MSCHIACYFHTVTITHVIFHTVKITACEDIAFIQWINSGISPNIQNLSMDLILELPFHMLKLNSANNSFTFMYVNFINNIQHGNIISLIKNQFSAKMLYSTLTKIVILRYLFNNYLMHNHDIHVFIHLPVTILSTFMRIAPLSKA